MNDIRKETFINRVSKRVDETHCYGFDSLIPEAYLPHAARPYDPAPSGPGLEYRRVHQPQHGDSVLPMEVVFPISGHRVWASAGFAIPKHHEILEW